MNYAFGINQQYTSKKMLNRPMLASLVKWVFGYTNVGNYARSRVFKRLLKKLPLVTFNKILDLGCGFGEYSFMLAKKLEYAEITALDPDPSKIDILKKTLKRVHAPNISLHNGKIASMSDDDYDFIYSIDVFEHIPVDNMPFFKCYNKLKKGGFLLIKMPSKKQVTILPDRYFEEHHQWLEEEHPGQVFELEDLVAKLKEEGFKIIYADYQDGLLARLGWEISYLSKKIGPLFQLITLPLAKALVILDPIFKRSQRGNTIQVIARKPQ